jgi:hypothetical protein
MTSCAERSILFCLSNGVISCASFRHYLICFLRISSFKNLSPRYAAALAYQMLFIVMPGFTFFRTLLPTLFARFKPLLIMLTYIQHFINFRLCSTFFLDHLRLRITPQSNCRWLRRFSAMLLFCPSAQSDVNTALQHLKEKVNTVQRVRSTLFLPTFRRSSAAVCFQILIDPN